MLHDHLSLSYLTLSSGKNWRINEESCEFTSRVPLGEGASGKVLRGLYKGKPVAIKVLKSQAAAELREFEAEFRIACSVVSPYIVRLYGAIFGDKLKMVMELCEKGSLYDLLKYGLRERERERERERKKERKKIHQFI